MQLSTISCHGDLYKLGDFSLNDALIYSYNGPPVGKRKRGGTDV